MTEPTPLSELDAVIVGKAVGTYAKSQKYVK